MGHDVNDDLQRRLRASRPAAARPDDDAFDADLLARVRALPVAPRRAAPTAVALPVAAGVTLTATAAILLVGGPGDVGGPSSAAAIEQTLRWFDPPAGTVLHSRSVATQGGHTTIRESWQSGDDPGAGRLRIGSTPAYEIAGDALYDPATNTIYDPPGDAGARPQKSETPAKPPGDGGARPQKSGPSAELRSGDPVVAKVRYLLEQGHMTATGPKKHNGVEAWEISLKSDAGRPVWRLWVSAADGKPLELRDPGRDASEPPQIIRWPTYEVVRGADAGELLSLEKAHPSARVDRDPEDAAALKRRLGFDEG
jgi:hypothetical protein